MPNQKEHAKLYLKQLQNNPTENEVLRIIKSINSLKYNTSQEEVSFEYKIQIINEMENLILPKTKDGKILLEFSENQACLDLITIMRQKIKEQEGKK